MADGQKAAKRARAKPANDAPAPHVRPPRAPYATDPSCSRGRLYPEPESRALRAALEKFTGVPAEYLLAGAGADELIDLLMRLILEPGDAILSCPPTFGMYPFDGELNAARVIEVPRREDFSLDMDAICETVDAHRPKILFVATPNNPDGSLLDANTIDRLLEMPLLVVLDEAYIEFAGENLGAGLSRIREVPSRENLARLPIGRYGGN